MQVQVAQRKHDLPLTVVTKGHVLNELRVFVTISATRPPSHAKVSYLEQALDCSRYVQLPP